MAFKRDVQYIEDGSPPRVDLSGAELARVARLIGAALPELMAARDVLVWEGAARQAYDVEVGTAETLLRELRWTFAAAGEAMDAYGIELARAQSRVSDGDTEAAALAGLLDSYLWAQSGTVRDSEPLAQWEDLREGTGILDRLADPISVEEIRQAADRHYHAAAEAYSDALAIEEAARGPCVDALDTAYRALPDFRADSTQAERILATTPGLLPEAGQATRDPGTRLAGQGLVPPFGVDADGLTNQHEVIIDRAALVATDGPTWGTGESLDWIVGEDSEHQHDFRLGWVHAYGAVIESAAEQFGIPASLLAGVAYKEVGGKPLYTDDAVDRLRERGLYPGDQDDTSYGPMSIQVDTAAVALGYEPDDLSDAQRQQIITSLKDPEQSILIAASVLAQEKRDSGFAYTEPADMTAEQGEQLAARYNGGPNWQGPDAQRYTREYIDIRDQAEDALRRAPS